MKTKSKESMPLSGEEIVARYFKCMDSRDLDGMLELFDYDAVVYEPFSKVDGLYGKSAIEPFLKVAMMANSELQRKIKIEKTKNPNNSIVALITFEKGKQIKGRFTFEFTDNDDSKEKKIKSLHIEFL
ncbi:MAG TPA: nuclear transport factor 2 family protein [Nitrososphaeraceae archaeon]|nr:nuclear transport factor 2 family protein [Nitrososphaeraceae archaeon]